MLEEFMKFIMRGNVVDLAVGVIITVAFGSIVSVAVNLLIVAAVLFVMIQGSNKSKKQVSAMWKRKSEAASQCCPFLASRGAALFPRSGAVRSVTVRPRPAETLAAALNGMVRTDVLPARNCRT